MKALNLKLGRSGIVDYFFVLICMSGETVIGQDTGKSLLGNEKRPKTVVLSFLRVYRGVLYIPTQDSSAEQ